jgi:hypothetical protein
VYDTGDSPINVPVDSMWDDVFDQPGIDFADRDQPAPQVRDKL